MTKGSFLRPVILEGTPQLRYIIMEQTIFLKVRDNRTWSYIFSVLRNRVKMTNMFQLYEVRERWNGWLHNIPIKLVHQCLDTSTHENNVNLSSAKCEEISCKISVGTNMEWFFFFFYWKFFSFFFFLDVSECERQIHLQPVSIPLFKKKFVHPKCLITTTYKLTIIG